MSQQPTLDQSFASETKNISNPLTIQPELKDQHLLRKKRNLEIIERNFLIRRFYYPIRQNNEYEIEAKTYSILNQFDLDSPPYNKFASINNITPNAFWFLICTYYFPYYSNELIAQKEIIPEELQKLIEYINFIITNPISINKKNQSNLTENFNFIRNLQKIVNIFSKKNNNLNEKNNLFQTTSIASNDDFDINNLSCTNNLSSIKSLLENLIKIVEHQNEINIPSKIKNDFLLTEKYNRDNRVEEDFEIDIKFHTKNFKKYMEEVLGKEKKPEVNENEDDVVCCVCGDGEYEDDNLIIYCSKCNMTVHQKCYGVLIIPEEDWICHLCWAFDDINHCNNMECILCPNLGGAMKPCTLKKNSHVYKLMIKSRKNPFLRDNIKKNYNLNNNLINSFSDENKDNNKNKINNNLKNERSLNTQENYAITSDYNQISLSSTPPNPNYIIRIINDSIKTNISNNSNNDFNSNNHNPLLNIINNNSNNDNNINSSQNNLLNSSYRSSNIKDSDSIFSYSSTNKMNSKEENDINNSNPINNSFNKTLSKKQFLWTKNQNEIYLSEKIANENAWVHLSCALWLPELSIGNFDLKEKIKGIENIPKKRLQEQCNICLKSGFGPTIKCEKCDYHFHPECARRLKNFFLEINENENGETTFLAYCNKDAPPQILKKHELITQRKKEDVKKFSTLLQKDISSLNKISDNKQNNIFHPYCYNAANNIEMKKIIEDEKKIIKKIGKSNSLNETNTNSIFNNDITNNDSNKKNINLNEYNFEKDIELSNAEKNYMINAIRELLIDESNLTLEISKKDYSIRESEQIIITYDDIQYPEKFSWPYLKESQYYLNGLSNYEIFKIFQSLIPYRDVYAKHFLKGQLNNSEKQKKFKNKENHKLKAQTENLEKYCICSKNDIHWVACENDKRKCKGKGWYHLSCIPELKDYTMNSFENHFEHYYCPECRKNYNLKNVLKKEVNGKNSSLNQGEKSNRKKKLVKKKKSNVTDSSISNNESKLEENYNKDNNNNNNGVCPMEIEENINEEKNGKNDDKKK